MAENMYEAIESGKYTTKMQWPQHPKKTAVGLASGLYGKEYAKFTEQRKAYNADCRRLDDLFREDAIRAVGLEGHPKAGKAFAYAYEKGHSAGHSEVFSELQDVAALLKD